MTARQRLVRAPRRRSTIAIAALVLCSRCGEDAGENPPTAIDSPPAAPVSGGQFTQVPNTFGWIHVTSNSGEYRLPEIMCGGVALLDYDGDEDLDIFCVQAGTWNDLTPGAPYPGHALLRNDGHWHFTDVAREAGVFGPEGFYGHGAVAADYDHDGDVDLFVTGFDRNLLYRNDGDGQFDEIAEEAGVIGGSFATSACFFDADGDGWLDLYVAHYIAYTHEANRKMTCGEDTANQRDYCSPRMFDGVQDAFYKNLGDGTFEECALEVGLAAPQPIAHNAKGLGVVAGDFDGDGDPDLYVANDATANLLYLNDGNGHFREEALGRGCAYSPDGFAQAGMGVDCGDVDGDGDLDLWVVHLDSENNALYRNDGGGHFIDGNVEAGLHVAARGKVGFGTELFDADLDGDLDVTIAHGHVLMHADTSRQTVRYRQESQFLVNDGSGRFALQTPQQAGPFFGEGHIARGLVQGDLDGDGDLDLVITSRDESPALLRNDQIVDDSGGEDVLVLDLRVNGRSAVGAVVRWQAGDTLAMDDVRAGSSYCSCSSALLHLGLGTATATDSLTILWPDGTKRELGHQAGGRRLRIDRERDEIQATPLGSRQAQ